MANIIKGNRDGEGGRNESYTIPGRGTVARKGLVREVEQGKHPNFSTYTREGKTYVRGNPDSTETNNVNED
jgi:hypothetical protein